MYIINKEIKAMIHRRIEMIAIILAIITISWSWPWEKTRAIDLVKAYEDRDIKNCIKCIEDKITRIKGWNAQDKEDNNLLISFEFSTNRGDYGWYYEVKLIPGLKETTGKVGTFKAVVGDNVLMDKYNIDKSDDYFIEFEGAFALEFAMHDLSDKFSKNHTPKPKPTILYTLGRKRK